MWELVPQPGMEPVPQPAVEGRSLNHWTTREVPRSHFFKHQLLTMAYKAPHDLALPPSRTSAVPSPLSPGPNVLATLADSYRGLSCVL